MILLNAGQCPNCKEFLVSKHRHDYVVCKCEAISLDGGVSYLKRSGYLKDLSICLDARGIIDNPELSHFLIRECFFWGKNYTKDMKRLPETEWIPIKDLDTSYIKAILRTQPQISSVYSETFKRELEWRS
jgi:hypothetical protein